MSYLPFERKILCIFKELDVSIVRFYNKLVFGVSVAYYDQTNFYNITFIIISQEDFGSIQLPKTQKLIHKMYQIL